MKRFMSNPELLSLVYFTLWLAFALAGPISGQIGLWKWDTEVHSTSSWLSTDSAEPLISARYNLPPGEIIPRFSEVATQISAQEVLPYLSTPAISGWAIAGISQALTSFNFTIQSVVVLSYVVSILFAYFVWSVFIRNLGKLAGNRATLALFAVFASSLWFLADLTSIHWNPMIRFAPFFFVPLFLELIRSGRNVSAVGIGAISVLISSGNGFELLGFALCAALTLLVILGRSSAEFWLYTVSLSLGAVVSAGFWMVSLALRLDGGLQATTQHILFTATKHGTDERLDVPDGAVGQSEAVSIGEALSSLLLGSSPLIPFTERSDFAIGLFGLAIMLTSAVVFLTVALGRAFIVYREEPAKLVTVAALLLTNVLVIIAMKNYVVNHGHILSIFSLFSFVVPIVVMKRALR